MTRSDLVGKDQGATSTSIARLDFSPETTTLPHYHPETEESMFCLSGELQAVYGRGAHILYAGDMFTAEPGVRHGISNPSGAPSVLPAIHPTTAPVSVLTHQ